MASRDARIDPQPGDKVGFRDKPQRLVKARFIDACDTPCVIYTVERVIPLKAWKRYTRNAYFDLGSK